MKQDNASQPIESITANITINTQHAFSLVREGTEIRRRMEEDSERLDKIKAELREFAKFPASFHVTETGTVEIRDPESELCAQVISPKDTPAIIKGVDVEPVVGQLTASQFDLLFRRVTVMQPAEKFEQAFRVLPSKTQKALKKIVTWVPNTPQVKFSK